MSLSDENRAIIVTRELEKALANYNQAVIMREHEQWDAAANRLYYAVFHAINSLLIQDKHEVRTHHGTGMLFRQTYIKTGILQEEHSDTFTLLQTMREKSDYNCSFEATRGLIEPLFDPSKKMIDTITAIIKKEPNI